MKITFNLKEPNKAESLILLYCRWNGNLVKLSIRHRIECKVWNKEKQQCLLSKSRFSEKTNSVSEKTNRFINSLKDLLCFYFESEDFNEETAALSSVRDTLEHLIDTLVEAEKVGANSLRQTPIDFFKKHVEQKRIDPHTGRYIAERTKKGWYEGSLKILQRFCTENGTNPNPNRRPIEEWYDSSKTAKENLEWAKSEGVKVSRSAVFEYRKSLIQNGVYAA